MNYIEEIAVNEPVDTMSANDLALWRIYAVLCLVAGEGTTNEHVHDAWSARRAATKPDHKSLVPFAQLTAEVQELDSLYRDAIRTVALGRGVAV